MRLTRFAVGTIVFLYACLTAPPALAADPPAGKKTLDLRIVDGHTQQPVAADALKLEADWGNDDVPYLVSEFLGGGHEVFKFRDSHTIFLPDADP